MYMQPRTTEIKTTDFYFFDTSFERQLLIKLEQDELQIQKLNNYRVLVQPLPASMEPIEASKPVVTTPPKAATPTTLPQQQPKPFVLPPVPVKKEVPAPIVTNPPPVVTIVKKPSANVTKPLPPVPLATPPHIKTNIQKQSKVDSPIPEFSSDEEMMNYFFAVEQNIPEKIAMFAAGMFPKENERTNVMECAVKYQQLCNFGYSELKVREAMIFYRCDMDKCLDYLNKQQQ